MKQKKYLFQVFVLVVYTFFVFPQQEGPIEISPYIGDNLDRVERDYFNLLPKIEVFKEAEFYLNPDSSLKVNVQYMEDSQLRDTVINKYSSLKKVQNHILQTLTYYINNVKPNERGKYCKVFLVDRSEFSGELLAVEEKSVSIFPMSKSSYQENERVLYNIAEKNINNIEKISIQSTTNLSWFIFPLLGMTAGAIVGYNIAKNHKIEKPYLFYSEDVENFSGIFFGALVGVIASIPLVFLLPIETTSETIMKTPFTDDELEGLRDRSRYKDELPYYLSIVK